MTTSLKLLTCRDPGMIAHRIKCDGRTVEVGDVVVFRSGRCGRVLGIEPTADARLVANRLFWTIKFASWPSCLPKRVWKREYAPSGYRSACEIFGTDIVGFVLSQDAHLKGG